uniref:sterol desaturase family protein n=1 Tax=Yoonia sp. TaxID=2212373 RepID=UPI0025E259C1
GLTALAFAGFSYITAANPHDITVMNVNIVVFAFYLVGYNLRHSHIWVNYPTWVSYIFISPAQHQTHHSIDPKHFDKNFGLIFAFWDWLFGTLYVPAGYEKLEFGISREEPNPFSSITEIYLKPFAKAWGLFAPKKAAAPLTFLVLAGGVAMLGAVYL